MYLERKVNKTEQRLKIHPVLALTVVREVGVWYRVERLFLDGCAVLVIFLLGHRHSPFPGQSRAVGPGQSSLDEPYSFLIQEGRS